RGFVDEHFAHVDEAHAAHVREAPRSASVTEHQFLALARAQHATQVVIIVTAQFGDVDVSDPQLAQRGHAPWPLVPHRFARLRNSPAAWCSATSSPRCRANCRNRSRSTSSSSLGTSTTKCT